MNETIKWDRRFLLLAREISSYSKDPSTKVGAVVVNSLGQVVGSGYNGFPRGVSDDPLRYLDREVKYKFIVHAELNALLMAGKEARGCTLYVWPTLGFPPTCNECAKAVIQSGIQRVVGFARSFEDIRNRDKWLEAALVSEQMYQEADVELVEVPW